MYPLSERIKSATRDLQVVMSFPVYEPATKGLQSGRILGVLNLDSKSPNAYDLLTNPANIDQVKQAMQTTAEIAARFFA
jgi:hypothetical protein